MHEVLWEGAKQVMDKTLRGNSRSVHENLAHCRYERQISANTMCIVSWFCLCNTKDMGNISKSGTKLPPFLYFLLFHAPWTWENIWERDNMAEDIAEPSMSFFLHWNVPVAVHRILIYWIKLNWCISKPLWPISAVQISWWRFWLQEDKKQKSQLYLHHALSLLPFFHLPGYNNLHHRYNEHTHKLCIMCTVHTVLCTAVYIAHDAQLCRMHMAAENSWWARFPDDCSCSELQLWKVMKESFWAKHSVPGNLGGENFLPVHMAPICQRPSSVFPWKAA